MNYQEIIAASRTVLHFDLGEPPTLARIRRLFDELYYCSALDPGYLFMTEDDRCALTADIMRNSAYTVYPWRAVAHEFGYDENTEWQMDHSPIRRMRNLVTGSSVRVVSLPGLEAGSVLLGFFR